MGERPPRILAIAGSDSSGGAGIQADIKTITMLGGYAMTAITAITVQNTVGVRAIGPLSPGVVVSQIDACLEDIGVDAIKIGMLGSAEIAGAVADRLVRVDVPVVFDPVMVATSGDSLSDASTIAQFERIMRFATLTTPNFREMMELGGSEELEAKGIPFLVTGGDADGDEITDVLIVPGLPTQFMEAPRIHTRHTHGTGCTLASAIATLLGRGQSLVDAVYGAREFVRSALLAAPGFGQGHGPMGHHAVRQREA